MIESRPQEDGYRVRPFARKAWSAPVGRTHLIIQEFEKSFLCEDAQHIRISLNRSPSQSMSNPLERAIRPGMAQSGVELIKAFYRAHATDRPSHPDGPRGGQASGLCSPALDKLKANGGPIAQCEALWTCGVPHGSWSTWRGSSSRATEPGKPLTYPVPIASPRNPACFGLTHDVYYLRSGNTNMQILE